MIRVALCLLSAILLSGCERNVHEYKYRLTLEVSENGHVYTGSSVVRVHQGTAQTLDAGDLLRTSLRGQAVVVDLGNGRVLCALLTGPSVRIWRIGQPAWRDAPSSVLIEAYGRSNANFDAGLSEVVALREPRDIAFDRLPALAASTNSADPSSFQQADPYNLEPVLGPGVRLQRATIELTDESVTTGITQTFPWLAGRSSGQGIDGRPATLNGLTVDDFVRGVK